MIVHAVEIFARAAQDRIELDFNWQTRQTSCKQIAAVIVSSFDRSPRTTLSYLRDEHTPWSDYGRQPGSISPSCDGLKLRPHHSSQRHSMAQQQQQLFCLPLPLSLSLLVLMTLKWSLCEGLLCCIGKTSPVSWQFCSSLPLLPCLLFILCRLDRCSHCPGVSKATFWHLYPSTMDSHLLSKQCVSQVPLEVQQRHCDSPTGVLTSFCAAAAAESSPDPRVLFKCGLGCKCEKQQHKAIQFQVNSTIASRLALRSQSIFLSSWNNSATQEVDEDSELLLGCSRTRSSL